jgi:hypothetical protein
LKKALREQCFFWLGRPDLNRRMRESKSRALPLGYIPKYRGKDKNAARRFLFLFRNAQGFSHPTLAQESGEFLRRTQQCIN